MEPEPCTRSPGPGFPFVLHGSFRLRSSQTLFWGVYGGNRHPGQDPVLSPTILKLHTPDWDSNSQSPS